MHFRNVPSTGPRYWTGISTASVFGANFGDFVSRDLHMGHASGLPALALVLAAILVAERRSRTPSEAYYWLAIVVVRTAATNLADLATRDAQLSYPMTAITLVVCCLLCSLDSQQARIGEPFQQLGGAIGPLCLLQGRSARCLATG